MNDIIQPILDWSEVWALLIPLFVLMLKRQQPVYMKPVIVYLWLAILLNLSGDIVVQINFFNSRIVYSNNPLYNLHSLIRFTCFAWFFSKIKQHFFFAYQTNSPGNIGRVCNH
jgi:hypothetical protein